MACHVNGAKPLSKPMLLFVHGTIGNILQWTLNQNTGVITQKIYLKMSACDKIQTHFMMDILTIPINCELLGGII